MSKSYNTANPCHPPVIQFQGRCLRNRKYVYFKESETVFEFLSWQLIISNFSCLPFGHLLILQQGLVPNS